MKKGGFLAHRSHTRSADEPEIWNHRFAVGATCEDDPPGDPAASLGRGEDPHCLLDGLRGESSIAELCRREGIAEGLYYSWSKEFLEAGKRRLAGDTARAATSSEVTELRRQARSLKEVVAEQALELRLLKKSMIADGEDGQ